MENEELENVDKAVISGTQRVSALLIMYIRWCHMPILGLKEFFFQPN